MSSNSVTPLKLFIPITKVDEAKRLVYGVATAEKLDRAGEICDYAGTKPLYEAWSADFERVTDGKSLGNLRAMHGAIAAGKLTGIAFNDDEKQIEIVGKVVDDGEWNKVLEGVYTGFSQGGAYVKRWKDEDDVVHYIANPVEVSLVDYPCLPEATFQYVKADGMVLAKHFTQGAPVATNDEIAARAAALAKAAGDETKWPSFVEAATAELNAPAPQPAAPVVELVPAQPVAKAEAVPAAPAAATAADGTAPAAPVVEAPELEQVWKTRDGRTFKTKDEARKHLAAPASPFNTALAALKTAMAPAAAVVEVVTALPDGTLDITDAATLEAAVAAAGALKAGRSVAARHIAKRARELALTVPETAGAKAAPFVKAERVALAKSLSLYTVGYLVSLLSSVECAEEEFEYDSMWGGVNATPELKTRFGALLMELGDIVAEALDMVLESMSEEETNEALARGVAIGALAKAGARHSRGDKGLLKTAHDALVKLGAECDMDKAAEPEALAKAAGLEVENKALTANLAKATETITLAAEAVTTMRGEVAKLGARVLFLEASPVQGGPAVTAASEAETAAAESVKKAQEALDRGDTTGALVQVFKSLQTGGRPLAQYAPTPVVPAPATAPAAATAAA